MHNYEKRLIFTIKLQKVIDHAYQRKREAAKRKQLYSLRVTDEDGIEPVGKSTNESTPKTSAHIVKKKLFEKPL